MCEHITCPHIHHIHHIPHIPHPFCFVGKKSILYLPTYNVQFL